jgi:hypothetical protein
VLPEASVHSHGVPAGAAAAFMMRPTTTPSTSTSKSSSFHSPDGRLAEARLRINGSDASNPKWQMIQESRAIRMAMRLEKRKARILR